MARGDAFVLPEDRVMVGFLGGHTWNGLTITKDQHKNLLAAYGYDENEATSVVEQTRQHHEARAAARAVENEGLPSYRQAPPLHPFDEAGTRNLYEAGTSRNLLRAAEYDGMRVMALLAKYLEPGEDPVNMVLGLMAEAGFDVPCVEEEEEEGA